MKEFLSHCEQETIQMARDLAKTLKPGTVIALHGDLGSGKTTFIKGIAVGLGLKDPGEVKSPTFALMHLYETRPPIHHFDLYRLETEKEISNIGFEELISQKAVSCVEWAERAQTLLPPSAIQIYMEVAGASERKIKIQLPPFSSPVCGGG